MSNNTNTGEQPRCYICLDVESAVTDEAGHRRYQAMERWSGDPDASDSRRGYKRDGFRAGTQPLAVQSCRPASRRRLNEKGGLWLIPRWEKSYKE